MVQVFAARRVSETGAFADCDDGRLDQRAIGFRVGNCREPSLLLLSISRKSLTVEEFVGGPDAVEKRGIGL